MVITCGRQQQMPPRLPLGHPLLWSWASGTRGLHSLSATGSKAEQQGEEERRGRGQTTANATTHCHPHVSVSAETMPYGIAAAHSSPPAPPPTKASRGGDTIPSNDNHYCDSVFEVEYQSALYAHLCAGVPTASTTEAPTAAASAAAAASLALLRPCC